MNGNARDENERGQILVLFTLALVAIMALVGLVLDGGSAFVQRRDMQNVADAAVMAAGYAYANTSNTGAAILAAQGVATRNGYRPGVNGVSMTVSNTTSPGGAVTFTVNLGKPHPNTFSGVVGQPSWNVATTASSITGAPNGANNFMPLIFNKNVNLNGFGPTHPVTYDEPGSGTGDVPQGPDEFNWTVFCLASGSTCNGDSSLVDAMINGTAPLENTTVEVGDEIGPLNAGAHATLFSDLAKHIDEEFPVAIVSDDGALIAVATFHLLGSVGGSTKQLTGYFVADANPEDMFIDGTAATGSSAWGSYVVKLTN